MKKKGQILGLPLVMLFAIIVASMVLFFGVRFILQLQSQGDFVQVLDVIDDIEGNVETYRNFDEGSGKVYDVELPRKVEKLCFYDVNSAFACNDGGFQCDSELSNLMQLVGESSFNVYLYPQGLYDINRFSIEDFQPEGGNPLCIPNGQSLVLTTYKDYVGIAHYEQ